MTDAQRLLLEQLKPLCRRAELVCVAEHRFAPPRRWRIDVALFASWPLVPPAPDMPWLAVEIDGGAYVQGRHSRGAGIEADNEKIAALAAHGFRFLRVTPKQVMTGQALAWIEAIWGRDAA